MDRKGAETDRNTLSYGLCIDGARVKVLMINMILFKFPQLLLVRRRSRKMQLTVRRYLPIDCMFTNLSRRTLACSDFWPMNYVAMLLRERPGHSSIWHSCLHGPGMCLRAIGGRHEGAEGNYCS